MSKQSNFKVRTERSVPTDATVISAEDAQVFINRLARITAKDYEFIIAATALPTYVRPWCEHRGDKRHIMGEIHDFLEDYAL